MPVTFKFKEYDSNIFGSVRRPIAEVFFKHQRDRSWQPITMIVDSGADYTLLPKFLATSLGVNLLKDCRIITTQGVGGHSKVYLLKKKIEVRIGEYERKIPVGFLNSDSVPPLLGRQEFFETFKVLFNKFEVTFE